MMDGRGRCAAMLRANNETNTSTNDSLKRSSFLGKYMGIAYSVMKDDPEGWRELTDGYVTMELRACKESSESPYRLFCLGKGGRHIELKITKDTKVRKMRKTFLQWVLKGSLITYGVQTATDKQLQELQASVEEAIQASKEIDDALQRDVIMQHRLQHLNRTGQTTEAFQILLENSKKQENQGKVMVRVTLPSSQSTVTTCLPSCSLQELLKTICAKRKLDPKTMGMKLPHSKSFLRSCELERGVVGDLDPKQVEIVDLAAIVTASADMDKVAAMQLLSSYSSCATTMNQAAARDVIIEVWRTTWCFAGNVIICMQTFRPMKPTLLFFKKNVLKFHFCALNILVAC
eukprot:m.122085 g.122085  ORF g.122085 m.122085 type:complete len:346 (+) comp12932_c3_seq9:220-1257(+)